MKRVNPKTNLPYKHGDKREDGYIFATYSKTSKNKNGFYAERWYSPEKFKNLNKSQQQQYSKRISSLPGYVKTRYEAIRKRSKNLNIPFNLDVEYLLSIFPDKCPVFNCPLLWNERKGIQPFSPSLDRINPNLGYVKGNVQWLSNLANGMKQNASPEQLKQFANWIISQHDSLCYA